MAAGNIPTPVVSTPPVLLTGALLGTTTQNQRALAIQVKNAWKTAGWTVVQAYNGGASVPAPGVDDWVTYADILGSGGGGTGFSFIVFGNPKNTMQVCLYCTVSGGWCEFQVVMSPAAGFTGGTTGARPTATDEIVSPGSTYPEFLGTGPSGNPQFYATVWVASDFSYTRVGWWYGGKMKSLWEFEQLRNVPNGWTTPFQFGMFSWGNTDYTVTGNRWTSNQYQTIFGSGGMFKSILTPGPNTVTSVEATIDGIQTTTGSVPSTEPIANGFSNQYNWTPPPGVLKRLGAASVNGFWGYTTDKWITVPSIFNDGDTMGDNFDFIIANQLILQWGLGAVGALLGGASTNYPTARWYGRSCADPVCNCGPSTCTTPTTPLVVLRAGAQELADKVNDASVSDITWNIWINQGIEDLWKRIVTATGDAFLSTFDFTLVGGVGGNSFDVTTIPARDFRRLRLLEVNPDTTLRRRVKPFNFSEKDTGRGPFANFVSAWSDDRRYRRMGTKIFVEQYEQAAGVYRLYYEPKTVALALTCDALPDVLDEWAEYPQVFAAMKALGKEEGDPGYLPTRLAELRDDIAALKGEPDDDPDANVIADVEGDGDDRGGNGQW